MNKGDTEYRQLIIQMAREAGLFVHKEVQPELERFFQLATAWEREQCANVCDDIFRHWLQTDPDEKFATPDADDCARAIRARGETK